MQGDERTEKYKTSCGSCVFAERNSQNGDQLGCELGRLEKYIEQDNAQKTEDGHYIIQTVCAACRGDEWLKAQPIDRSAVSLIEEEIQIPIAFVIVSIDDDPAEIKRLLSRRVSECVNQKFISPSQIIVVLKNKEADSRELHDLITDIAGEIPTKLVRIVNDEYDFSRSLDMGIQHVKAHYYCVIQLEHNVPTNMLKTINDIINIDIKPVSMIQPSSGGYSGLVVQTLLHKVFGGNRVEPIYEKIAEASRLQGKEAQILNWEELWTRQKSPL